MTKKFVFRSGKYNITHQDIQRGIEDRGYVDDNPVTSTDANPLDKWHKYAAQRTDENIFPSSSVNISRIQIHDAVNRLYDSLLHSIYNISAEVEKEYRVGLNFNKHKIYNYVEERLLQNPQDAIAFTKDPQQFLVSIPEMSIKNILVFQGGDELSNTTLPVLKTNLGTIVGHHKDGTFEKGLQGPFAEQNVGGYKHRHQPLGSTTDRPERFRIQDDGDTITFTSPVSGAAGPNYNHPYARVSRHGFTKSPVNIRNIKITGTFPLGNFTRNYEILSGLSRRNQNLSLVDQPQNFSTSSTQSPFISGVFEYPVPNRTLSDGTYNKTVFVNKFGAPGDVNSTNHEYLDSESEELSAYNTLNYRNATPRFYLKSFLGIPSYFGGYRSGSFSVSASYKKVQRNNRRIAVSGTQNFRLREDNSYASYGIPATDKGFSWISRSALAGNNPGLYENGADNDISFFSGSALFDLLGGFSNLYDYTSYVPSGIYSAGPFSNNLAYRIIGNIKNNKIWGKSTKRQISNHDNKLLKIQRGNNYFTDEINSSDGKQLIQVEARDSNIKDKYTNTTNIYEVDDRETETLSYPFAQEYSSLMSNYYDASDNKIKNFYKDNRNIFYSDKSASLFKKMLDFDRFSKINGLPSKKIKEIKHEEKIYPKGQNVFRNFSRSRTLYYQKWNDNFSDRLTELTNSQGKVYSGTYTNLGAKYSFWPLDANTSASYITIAGSYAIYIYRDKSGELMQLDNYANIYGASAYNEVVPLGTYFSARFGRNWNLNRPANVVFQQAGRGPYPNSYEEFNSDIKLIGQNCSIIPEYRVSPRLDEHYSGNLSIYDSSLSSLELTGTAIEDSSISVSTSSAFIEQRVTSDFVDMVPYLNEELQEYKLNSIKIKVKGIKKFLPYEEFYPQIKMLKLAEQFSSSYSEGFAIGGTKGTFRTALSPFYSPGIGFNSIKSGVGMPYSVAKSSSVDSYSLITSSFGIASEYYQKLPWETILSPYKSLLSIEGGKIYDIDTDMPIDSTASINREAKANNLYDKKANNFYSEVVNFFKNSSLSTLASKPNTEWKFPDLTKKYALDFVIGKHGEFFTYSSPENFGPKPYVFHNPPWTNVPRAYTTSSAFNSDRILAPNYATSSSESYIRMIFDPSQMFIGDQDYAIQGRYTLADIIRHSVLEYSSSFAGDRDYVITVEDLLDIYSASKNSTVWSPRLKWECPTADLNFNNLSASLTNSVNYDSGDSIVSSSIRGIWHQYAPISNNEDGLFLSVRYSTTDSVNTGSLLDAVGFNPEQRVKIGQVASSKEITEAVVLIPFYSDECGVDKYFDIDIDDFEKAYQNNSGIIGETKYLSRKYVLPPSLDYVNFREKANRRLERSEYAQVKSPFLMFSVEFSSLLSKQDLADVWQGVSPSLSEAAEIEFQEKEFYIGQYLKDLNYKLPDDTRFKIFKVKRRAITNYQQLVDSTLGNEYTDLSLGYNWPYDYFSLVEMAEVKAELRYSYNLDRDEKKVTDTLLENGAVEMQLIDNFIPVKEEAEPASQELTLDEIRKLAQEKADQQEIKVAVG
jgi:hypothetical protein